MYRRRWLRFLRRIPWPLRLILFVTAGLLLLNVVLVLSGVLFMTLLLGATIGGAVMLFRVARFIRRYRRARRRGGGAGPASVPTTRHVTATDPGEVWRSARHRFEALRAEYASYECDPLAVLRLPALADVTVPATARFVDAFAEAQALHSESQPPAGYVTAYQGAVDRAWQAWRAAKDAAERIRLAGLTPEERGTVERVVKLLTMAQNNSNEAERLAAYGKARAELGKLERSGRLHLPRPALAYLDEAARTSLPPSMPQAASAARQAGLPGFHAMRPSAAQAS